MTRATATATGFTAVLLWALLALLTVGSAPTPPFLLNGICFAIGGAVGLVWLALTGQMHRLRSVRPAVYAFGIAGLFGYHALYFSALRLAPPAEAGLIAYLWPLLIVLFSGLLPGERLGWLHVIGALVAFAGAALIVLRAGTRFDSTALPGLAIAGLCALTWSSYSVASRRMGHVPTAAVTVFCLGAAVLSVPAHLALEPTVWPDDALGWLCIVGLGLGPVGLAFFVWDIGMKRGDIQLLGTASYAAPLLSTLALVLAGVTDPGPILFIAALLIAAGAGLAALGSARIARASRQARLSAATPPDSR